MIGKMKRNAGWVILTLALLFIQAACDLQLPDYTSKIVDIGIQQKGIEDAVPNAVSESTYEELIAVSDPETGKMIEDSYRKDDSGYSLRKISKDERQQLSEAISGSEIILAFARAENVDLSQMSPEQINALTESFRGRLKEYPEMIESQYAIAFVAGEYESLGINTDAMQRSYMLTTGAKMIGIAFISVVAAIIVTFLASRIAAMLARDIRKEIYQKVLSFSSAEMNRFSTASLITRSTNDIQQVQMVTMMLFRIVVFAPCMATGALIKVSQTGSYLRWILVVAVAATAAIVVLIFALAMPRFKVLQKKVDRINLIGREMLTGVPVVRAFQTEHHEEERFDEANTDFKRTNLFVSRLMAGMMPAMMLVMNLVSVLIIYSGAKGIDLGKLQVGDMMAFMQYAMHVIISFLFISSIAIFMPRASVAAERIFEVLDTVPVIDDPAEPKPADGKLKGTLEYDDVSFAYPDAGENALSHILFKAEPGQTIAFIGSTGSGKSTIVSLLMRFFDVTGGSIRIDGTDIRDLSLKDLRSRIGYVPQKAVLFSGTVRSNLEFGSDTADDDLMRRAVEIAQASDFVFEEGRGFDGEISQGGANVSGGQKQRLQVARAIVRQPEFYVFDDSFSALDFKTDSMLRKRLHEECSGVTTLIVAQRISTIMNADCIIVLHEGRMIGKGTHEELMETCDAYREIAQLQLSARGEEDR